MKEFLKSKPLAKTRALWKKAPPEVFPGRFTHAVL
jgi:hypothetical protein